MASSHRRNYLVTAEPGIDWDKVVDTMNTIAADAMVQIEKGTDGTTAWAYAYTYHAPFDMGDVAKVMAAHPEITKMIRSTKGKPEDPRKLKGFYGTKG